MSIKLKSSDIGVWQKWSKIMIMAEQNFTVIKNMAVDFSAYLETVMGESCWLNWTGLYTGVKLGLGGRKYGNSNLASYSIASYTTSFVQNFG